MPIRTGRSSPSSDDPHFKPRPAVVTRIRVRLVAWRTIPGRSQWISLAGYARSSQLRHVSPIRHHVRA